MFPTTPSAAAIETGGLKASEREVDSLARRVMSWIVSLRMSVMGGGSRERVERDGREEDWRRVVQYDESVVTAATSAGEVMARCS